jgi:gamma-glutamyl-gamma-aminobutyrate hydrolase PuuD
MPGGQNTACNLYGEDKNEEDMWEEPRRDTEPVYVAAAAEWVKIGPKLQGRRGICYAFKLSILNFSADWHNAKHCYCIVRCYQTARISGVV